MEVKISEINYQDDIFRLYEINSLKKYIDKDYLIGEVN